MNPLRKNDPVSLEIQAKLDKEKLNGNEPTERQILIDKYKSNGISSGNKNLCKFGAHNPTFNKYCI